MCWFSNARPIRRITSLGICLALLLAAPGFSQAGGKLRIGTSGDYPPFSERVTDGYRGFDIEVATAFAAEHGFEIEWVRFSWPELANDVEQERFDIAMSGVTVRPDRSAIGRFSVPVVASGAFLLIRAGVESAKTLSLPPTQRLQLLDRPETHIAVNAGGHLERVTRSKFQRARIEAIPDNASVRRSLISGNCHAVVTDSIEAPIWLEGTTDLTTLGPLTEDRKAYLTRADRAKLSESLDTWLLAREADGTLERWRKKYFGSGAPERTAEPMTALLASINERLSLMPLVAEAKRKSARPVEDIGQERRVLAAAVERINTIAKRERRKPLDPGRVRAFYQAQIDAAKAIQTHVLAESPTPSRKIKTYDLSDVLRPALSRISVRIAELLVEVAGNPLPNDFSERVEREVHPPGLEMRRIRQIESAIAAVSGEVFY